MAERRSRVAAWERVRRELLETYEAQCIREEKLPAPEGVDWPDDEWLEWWCLRPSGLVMVVHHYRGGDGFEVYLPTPGIKIAETMRAIADRAGETARGEPAALSELLNRPLRP